MQDTIVAIATSTASSSAIGIVRMSGDMAYAIISKVFKPKNAKVDILVPNTMYLGTIFAENFKEEAMVVYFEHPHSYTGEDVVELQCHGSSALLERVLALIVKNGARPAFAGEFSKRAFLNNKLTLEQAEGVLNMINARSEAQMMQAYRLLSGQFAEKIKAIADILLTANASLEMLLDYGEELASEEHSHARELLLYAKTALMPLIASSKLARVVNEGIYIAIVGAPNAGKSSLLNTLIGAERAIVTDIEGTTRDILRETLDYDGVRLNFVDTAGIRESIDVVEKIGIERAKQAILSADLVLLLLDATKPSDESEQKLLELCANKKVIKILNKNDNIVFFKENDIAISAKNGNNCDELLAQILELSNAREVNNESIVTTERHRFAILDALKSIDCALENYNNLTADCLIVDIRNAYSSLASIFGIDVNESVVEKVFSAFCVGK